jgi:hypothetical protein
MTCVQKLLDTIKHSHHYNQSNQQMWAYNQDTYFTLINNIPTLTKHDISTFSSTTHHLSHETLKKSIISLNSHSSLSYSHKYNNHDQYNDRQDESLNNKSIITINSENSDDSSNSDDNIINSYDDDNNKTKNIESDNESKSSQLDLSYLWCKCKQCVHNKQQKQIDTILEVFSYIQENINNVLSSDDLHKMSSIQQFTCGTTPSCSIDFYINRIVKNFESSDEALACALYHIVDLAKRKMICLNERSIHRYFGVLFLITTKMYDDEHFSQVYISKVCGISIVELNKLEGIMLNDILKWKAHVNLEHISNNFFNIISKV